MAKKLQRRVVKKGPAEAPETGGGAAPRRARSGRRVSSQSVTEFTVQLAMREGPEPAVNVESPNTSY